MLAKLLVVVRSRGAERASGVAAGASILAAALLMAMRASAEPALMVFEGDCFLEVAGETTECRGMFAFQDPELGRVSFNVATELGALGFSGGKDFQPSLGQYILLVDSIVDGRGGESARHSAQGRCDVSISDDGHTIHSLKCSAASPFGAARLSFSGRSVD